MCLLLMLSYICVHCTSLCKCIWTCKLIYSKPATCIAGNVTVSAVMENQSTPSDKSDWRIQQHCGITNFNMSV